MFKNKKGESVMIKDFDTVTSNDIGNCSRKQCDNNNRYYEDDRTNKYVDQCAVCSVIFIISIIIITLFSRAISNIV
jgi:hypothetical protein